MSRVITFSRVFPSYHPRKGEETYFVEKIWKGLPISGEYSIWTKHPRLMKDGSWQIPHLWRDQMIDKDFSSKVHTIRAGNRWKVGDKFSPRVWSGKPYRSKQIIIAPDIEIKKVWNINMVHYKFSWFISTKEDKGISIDMAAKNDGLTTEDFMNWFPKNDFAGQIICWNENINY